MKAELLVWMNKGVRSSVDIRRWGLENYYTRADRTAREFAEMGLVRRIPDKEAILMGLVKNGRRIAFYEPNNTI